jgi:hypothetical protein
MKTEGGQGDFESHEVHIYLEYYSVYPLVRIGTPPTPLPQASVPSRNQRGVHTQSPACKGVGESPFRRDDWRKSLALCLPCGKSISLGPRRLSFFFLLNMQFSFKIQYITRKLIVDFFDR